MPYLSKSDQSSLCFQKGMASCPANLFLTNRNGGASKHPFGLSSHLGGSLRGILLAWYLEVRTSVPEDKGSSVRLCISIPRPECMLVVYYRHLTWENLYLTSSIMVMRGVSLIQHMIRCSRKSLHPVAPFFLPSDLRWKGPLLRELCP